MGEAVPANLRTQLQSRTPVRVAVPMEELAARANRFVSLLVGHTENPKPSPSSSKERLWLRSPLVELRRLQAEGVALHPEDRDYLDRQQDHPNR